MERNPGEYGSFNHNPSTLSYSVITVGFSTIPSNIHKEINNVSRFILMCGLRNRLNSSFKSKKIKRLPYYRGVECPVYRYRSSFHQRMAPKTETTCRSASVTVFAQMSAKYTSRLAYNFLQ